MTCAGGTIAPEFGMYRYDVVFRRPADPAATDTPEDVPRRGTTSNRGTLRSSLAEIEAVLVAGCADYLAFAEFRTRGWFTRRRS